MKLCSLLPCCLWVIFSHGDCRQATITITPQSLTLQPNQSDTGGTVTVICQASGLESRDILIVMNIIKTVGNTVTQLVVTDADYNASLEQNTGLTGASVSGGITPGPATSTMRLTLTQARCDEDEGMYTCKITVLQTSPRETKDYFGHGNLSVEVSPGPVLLTPSPSGTTSWTVGETLAMTCNAPVGTVEDDTQIEWVWQLRNTQNVLSTVWSAYDGSNIDIEDGTMVPMQCYQRRVSILTRQLTEDDNNREYRCYIRRRQGQGGFENFDQYAGVHAVGSVSQANTGGGTGGGSSGSTDTNTGCGTGGGSSGSTDSATQDKAVIIALGSVLAVVIIGAFVTHLVVLVWLWRRGWVCPCADIDKDNDTQLEVNNHRNAAAVSEGDYLELVDNPPNYQAPTGPYDSLNMSDVGQKNVYAEINNRA